LGIGDWGLGIGDWAQSPIPNPQSPIPNPQSPKCKSLKHFFKNYLKKVKINNLILKSKFLKSKKYIHFICLYLPTLSKLTKN